MVVLFGSVRNLNSLSVLVMLRGDRLFRLVTCFVDGGSVVI